MTAARGTRGQRRRSCIIETRKALLAGSASSGEPRGVGKRLECGVTIPGETPNLSRVRHQEPVTVATSKPATSPRLIHLVGWTMQSYGVRHPVSTRHGRLAEPTTLLTRFVGQIDCFYRPASGRRARAPCNPSKDRCDRPEVTDPPSQRRLRNGHPTPRCIRTGGDFCASLSAHIHVADLDESDPASGRRVPPP